MRGVVDKSGWLTELELKNIYYDFVFLKYYVK